MQTSKAFRCTPPMLREDQVANLRRWADLHCARSIVFRDDRGFVFVGLKAELRNVVRQHHPLHPGLELLQKVVEHPCFLEHLEQLLGSLPFLLLLPATSLPLSRRVPTSEVL